MAKNLSDMSLEELWELFPITLCEHRDCWFEWFEEERGHLMSLLDKVAPIIISHIGSTAVPGIYAKPIIDILIEFPDKVTMQRARTVLVENHYSCMSDKENRISLNKGYTESGYAEKVFHIHLRLKNDNVEIQFRDYLRSNPNVALEYERLKISLLPEFRNNRDAYTAAKTDFVTRISNLAKQSS